MNTNYEKIKADLLAFGKKNGACVEQYQRLYKATKERADKFKRDCDRSQRMAKNIR